MKRIIIMGLPGSGKTRFAEELKRRLEANNKKVEWLNGDEVRAKFDDWDFSIDGRIRQSVRMKQLSEASLADFVIADFVAPLKQMRDNYDAHWTIWIDTISEGRFEDTNKMFEPPSEYDFRINTQDCEFWVQHVLPSILSDTKPQFDWKKETVQMLGRWQPWHQGHRALFERALSKTGQVCIMIRDCQGWNGSNPFEINKVEDLIKKDLDPLYKGKYTILFVPNIVEIVYGRDVGYSITKIELDKEIEKISATNIRKEMGLQ